MSMKASLEDALENVYGGIITSFDENQIKRIEELYRMPLEGILGTLTEMLLTDNPVLYKTVNDFLMKKGTRERRGILDFD